MKTTALLAALFAGLPFLPAAEAQVILTSTPLMEQSAVAGEAYEGRIELTNSSDAAQHVTVYQTDYTVAPDGRATYGEPGRSPRSNAHWIELPAGPVVIPPRSKVTIRYSVAVPASPSLAGTYWSMLMIEADDRAADSPSHATDSRAGLSVRTKLRYGVQVATHVGAHAPIRIVFDSVRAASVASGRRLSYDFINSGDRAARLLMAVELFDASGSSVRKLEQQRGLLYPGHAARQHFDFGGLPAGTYTAIVTADAGGDEMFGAQYTLRF